MKKIRRRFLLIAVLIGACSGPMPASVDLPTPTQTERADPTSTPALLAETPTAPPHSSAHSTAVPVVTLPPSETTLITVDASVTYQTMDGFGATHIPLE